MILDINSFLAGVQERIEFAKTANLFEQEHSTFFPMLQTQTSWRYSRKGDTLHLHDGHNTFSFKYPENLADEDVPSERLPDSNKFDYEHEAKEKGTAQIHRADPGSIYVTLQDGRNNPTFTLQHQTGSTWKISPKKRLKKTLPETGTTVDVDPSSVIEGAIKEADAFNSFADVAGQGLDGAGNMLGKGIQMIGQHPYLAAGGALATALAMHQMGSHREGEESPSLYDSVGDMAGGAMKGLGLASLAHNVAMPMAQSAMGGNYF
jgi:hypothetical protein